MDAFFGKLQRIYCEYARSFAPPGGALPQMMQLKLVHTMKVVENAKAILEGENIPQGVRHLAMCAALLHDTGRYEQLKKYNSFKDSETVDHAVLSHDIAKAKGWLSSLSDAEQDAILTAVAVHNKKCIPETLDETTRTVCNVVRDSDKLDIFRVAEHEISTTDWRKNLVAFWNLPTSKKPSPKLVDSIISKRDVDYKLIESLPDFILIQVGWMISGLAFKTSRRLVRERNHLEFRRKFLHELVDDPCIDVICDIAKRTLEE